MKVKKGIKERWDTRVVPNGWDKSGSTGAQAYIAKYGKQINTTKLEDLAEYADTMGCHEFADEMRRHAKRLEDEWRARWDRNEQTDQDQ